MYPGPPGLSWTGDFREIIPFTVPSVRSVTLGFQPEEDWRVIPGSVPSTQHPFYITNKIPVTIP